MRPVTVSSLSIPGGVSHFSGVEGQRGRARRSARDTQWKGTWGLVTTKLGV